jgi:hypothetical protein
MRGGSDLGLAPFLLAPVVSSVTFSGRRKILSDRLHAWDYF